MSESDKPDLKIVHNFTSLVDAPIHQAIFNLSAQLHSTPYQPDRIDDLFNQLLIASLQDETSPSSTGETGFGRMADAAIQVALKAAHA